MKEYKVVPLSQLHVRDKKDNTVVSNRIEALMNDAARDGWVYYSMERTTQIDKKGCLNQVDKETMVTFDILIFEREING